MVKRDIIEIYKTRNSVAKVNGKVKICSSLGEANLGSPHGVDWRQVQGKWKEVFSSQLVSSVGGLWRRGR